MRIGDCGDVFQVYRRGDGLAAAGISATTMLPSCCGSLARLFRRMFTSLPLSTSDPAGWDSWFAASACWTLFKPSPNDCSVVRCT